MWKIAVEVENHPVFVASHILADLRIVAETLFYPLRQVGFWDRQADGMHFCPQAIRGSQCPHSLHKSDPDFVDYARTAEVDLNAVLEVYFRHSDLSVYLR